MIVTDSAIIKNNPASNVSPDNKNKPAASRLSVLRCVIFKCFIDASLLFILLLYKCSYVRRCCSGITL